MDENSIWKRGSNDRVIATIYMIEICLSEQMVRTTFPVAMG